MEEKQNEFICVSDHVHDHVDGVRPSLICGHKHAYYSLRR
jgi:hypothetical protein